MSLRNSSYLVTGKLFFVFGIAILFLSSCNRSNHPNVVLIVVDDLGYADMSCTGFAEDVHTPNIDQLAERGVRFTEAYATSPICNPSRAGIITGCYQQRWGTFFYGGAGIHDNRFRTIAEILKENGFATGYIGKVHYGSYDSDTNNRSFPLNHGFDYFYGFTSARKHYLIHDQDYEDDFLNARDKSGRNGQSLRKQSLWMNKHKVDTLAFSTELFGKQACMFIKNNSDNPFFLQLAFNAVHNFTHQLPLDYLDKKGLKGYSDWDPSSRDYYEWYKKGRYPNNPEGRQHYLGQLHFLDKEIGRLLDCLELFNLRDETMLVFIGDNGGSTPIYANNYPLKGSKYVLQEGGIRVPMIISYPQKFREGQLVSNVVSAMDLLPTICRVAGISSPGNIDGQDISMLLTRADTTIMHDTLFWDTGHEYAIRAGKWKLHKVKSSDYAKYEMVDLEVGSSLYNLETDPGETSDKFQDHPEIVLMLEEAHKNWKSSLSPD